MYVNQFVVTMLLLKISMACFYFIEEDIIDQFGNVSWGAFCIPRGRKGLVTGICFANRKTESTKVWNTSINSHSCTWRQVWCNEIQQNHLGWKIVFILPLNSQRNMMQNLSPGSFDSRSCGYINLHLISLN